MTAATSLPAITPFNQHANLRRLMTGYTVLTAEFKHESNTFCKLPTTLKSFSDRGFLFGAAAISARQDNNTELAGFLDAGRTYGWNMVHVLSAEAQPGGPVIRAAFDELTATIVAAVQ